MPNCKAPNDTSREVTAASSGMTTADSGICWGDIQKKDISFKNIYFLIDVYEKINNLLTRGDSQEKKIGTKHQPFIILILH